MKKIIFLFIILFGAIFGISCLTTFVVYSDSLFFNSSTNYNNSDSQLFWPLPEYHSISSPFGYRISPITGKLSFHHGIDIPSPENTPIYSISNGKVIYQNFNGANGYTLMISNNNLIISYGHISPNFVLKLGDTVSQKQLIAYVGPKYISDIPNNPYFDSSR